MSWLQEQAEEARLEREGIRATEGLKLLRYGKAPIWDWTEKKNISEEVINVNGNPFVIGTGVGGGTYGKVYDLWNTEPFEFEVEDGTKRKLITLGERSTKVMKEMKLPFGKVPGVIQEATIQQKLTEKEPGVCPALYEFGKIQTGNYLSYILIMERCEEKVRDLLPQISDEKAILDYLKQIAKILQRLHKYDFNHRDLKSDNVMFNRVPESAEYPLGKKYLLIDFGLACGTFDGKKYAGMFYKKDGECVRPSRDLALVLYELAITLPRRFPDLQRFIRLVLTFKQGDGTTCNMIDECAVDARRGQRWDWDRWTYNFLNRGDITNKNTTPEGLLTAIEVYEKKGIAKCEQEGFVMDPIADACVADPGVGKAPVSPDFILSPDTPKGGNRRGQKTRRLKKSKRSRRQRKRSTR